MPERVVVTQKAAELIRHLEDEFGPLIFHQSGGCCEGTAPMCFRQSDFRVGANDVFLGTIAGCPFHIGAPTFRYFTHSQLIIDVTTGGGDSFSIEAPEGVRFITRSRIFTDAEAKELDAAGPPPTGPGLFMPAASAA
jgi:uncharacterized protein (DUF779 family)